MTKGYAFQYIYGPVASWRLGRSLGVDPVSAKEKICSFDCVYCQLGKTRTFLNQRREFVRTRDVVAEIQKVSIAVADYITFSGAGEPTLAKNLGAMIKAVKKVRREKIAVITNASLMNRRDVQQDLALADFVLAKLDASSEAVFQKMNRPMPAIRFETVLATLKGFNSFYKGRLALQIMFTGLNVDDAEAIAKIAREIHPDEVEINTPLRPCGVQPLSEKVLNGIEQRFREICGRTISITNVYRAEKKKVLAFSDPETLRRRGKV